MEAERANAYRHLLYMAMVDIGSLAVAHSWACASNPRNWFRSRAEQTKAAVIANWLHNMAAFSATGFEGFDEARFWRDYEGLRARFPGHPIDGYRKAFDAALVGKPGGASYWPNQA
jgi:hypothetical protein